MLLYCRVVLLICIDSVAFSLINKSDLIHVNEEGEIIGGGETRLLNTAAFMIHSAIHKARPDVIAAAHSHSIYGRSFCTCLLYTSDAADEL